MSPAPPADRLWGRPVKVEQRFWRAENSGFAGKILEVYVTNGQPVQAGQALFKLEYATPATPPAGEKSGTVKVDAERLKQLYEQGIISRREWETATGARARTTSNEDGPASAAASPATLVIATTNAPIAVTPII